ncbi:MAG: mechanosensitive ion channel family protein [Alphaproteobacteria bacterium]|nr:mechanosensitive ion channel family protein [Alphaproteobacteria bacterium]
MSTAPYVYAQEILDLTQAQKELEAKQAELDAFELILLDNTLDDKTLFENRQSVKALRARSEEIQSLVMPLTISVSADLSDIGDPPDEKTGLEEPENIRDLRERLTKESLMVKGVMTQAEVLSSKSTRFLEQLAALRRAQFVEKILENSVSPFNAQLWEEVQGDKLQALESVREGWASLFEGKSDKNKQTVLVVLRILGGALALFFVLVVMVNSRILHRNIRKMDNPDINQKLQRVGINLLVSIGIGALSLAVLAFVADKHGLLEQVDRVSFLKAWGFILFILCAITNTWLLMAAGVIRKNVGLFGIITIILYAVDFVFLIVGRHLSVPVELVIVQSFLSTTIFSVLLLIFSIALVRREEERRVFLFKRRFFYVSAFVGVFVFGANALGYVALTRFIFEQTVLLTNFLITVLILRAMIRPILVWVEHFFYRNPEKEDNLALFWLCFLTDTALILLSLPLIAAIIGVEWEGIHLLIFQAISGFKVGGITISLISLATAVLLFIVLLFITRFIQEILAHKVLPKTRMEESVRLSFVQIIGYVGLTVAFMAAISSVGFDLSNLALIAGALSVGIGFGLQSIVSNFVSGLILLFERPIKVGDWVILSSGEGVVKRISVRATEIESLDRTSIIIPNSELISASVKNWTHKDRMGRLAIVVGVSYDADPQQVYDILLELAKESDLVLSSPLPSVIFNDFGDSALIFELRVFIRNVTDRFKIATELRLDIWKKLKEEEIEIPFPQRDIHIRSTNGSKINEDFMSLNTNAKDQETRDDDPEEKIVTPEEK